ncbi:MAG: NADH-quinone oxidoreductase subunit NuoE [Alphaproteobacteria bacterium]|nr:NADH-quinone oxidoreductase subunit NuoE [Alphaproteobacteria bacterium]
MSVRRLYHEQPESFAFNAENLAWARKTIAKYPDGKQASAVIPLLWRAQEQNDNWVSKPVIEYVADMLGMSYIRVLEVATFYTMFQLQPVGKVAHVQVCGTTPCMLRGAEDLKKVCQNRIHRDPHHLSDDGKFSWEEVECLGACVNAPMVQIFKDTYEDLTPASLEKLIDDLAAGRKVKVGPQIDRHHAAPEGGPVTLTDPDLYKGARSFTRVEPPPPPEAVPAAAAAAKAAEAPKAPAAPVAAPKMPEPAKPAEAKPVVAEEKKPEPQVKPMAEVKPVEITNPQAPPPAKFAELPPQPARKPARTETKPAVSKSAADEPKPARAKASDGQPALLKTPRSGQADDLKLIWGVGPKLEKMLNDMGIWHFDQVADWTAKELAWVDARLEGFKGRAKRDEWVKQAKKLAKGWRPDNAIGERPGKK